MIRKVIRVVTREGLAWSLLMAWWTLDVRSVLAQTTAGQGAERGVVEPPPEGFFDIVFAGGWIGALIMLLLLALSITAAYLVIDHLLTIRRSEIMPDGLSEQVRQLLSNGQLTEADQICRSNPSFLSFVLLNGLRPR